MSEPTFFNGLEAEAAVCAYCGYCRSVCPTYASVGWESCSPRGRVHLIRLLSQGLRLTASQMARLYQCTLCGHCTEVCPTRIDLRRFWLEARACSRDRHLSPEAFAATAGNVAETGNIYGYPNDERAGWAEYMEDAPPDLYQRERAEVVYFVGCSSSFSPRVQRIAESFARLLTAARVEFTILGAGEVCCGFPLIAAGMRDRATAVMEANLARVQTTGATTIVFTCPACRLAWLEEYAQRLPGVRMLHATEMLAGLLAEGRLRLKGMSRVVTYHDPCDLARNGGIYDPPRQLLAAIPGVRLVEVHERRERAACCGGGGDLEVVDPLLVGRVAALRAGRLAATGAQIVATACPQCVRTLAQAAAASAAGLEVRDVVELLAEALYTRE